MIAAGNSTITTKGSGGCHHSRKDLELSESSVVISGRSARGTVCYFVHTVLSPRARSIVLSLLEAVIDGEHDRLRARPHTKLVEEIRNVIANSLFTDRQTLGNLCVTQAF